MSDIHLADAKFKANLELTVDQALKPSIDNSKLYEALSQSLFSLTRTVGQPHTPFSPAPYKESNYDFADGSHMHLQENKQSQVHHAADKNDKTAAMLGYLEKPDHTVTTIAKPFDAGTQKMLLAIMPEIKSQELSIFADGSLSNTISTHVLDGITRVSEHLTEIKQVSGTSSKTDIDFEYDNNADLRKTEEKTTIKLADGTIETSATKYQDRNTYIDSVERTTGVGFKTEVKAGAIRETVRADNSLGGKDQITYVTQPECVATKDVIAQVFGSRTVRHDYIEAVVRTQPGHADLQKTFPVPHIDSANLPDCADRNK